MGAINEAGNDAVTDAVTGAVTDAGTAAEAVARRSYGRLIAYLSARTRDVAGAEDALSEAFAAALADWPVNGIPHTPEAWLLTVARRKLIDSARRMQSGTAAAEVLELIREMADRSEGGANAAIPDERLRLMFACAHPAIDRGVRAPLMLQVILGFDAAAIASAFLVSPAAMGQRLARAKNKIRAASIPFRVPEQNELRERLDVVLDAIYAVYAEGWSDPLGTETRRRNLAQEGLWLGRLVASLLPAEPEALGLLALMLHTEARRDARRNAAGDYVPLAEQDVTLWNAAMIDEAEALLIEASGLRVIGRYQLEAAVQSAHVVRRRNRSAGLADGANAVNGEDGAGGAGGADGRAGADWAAIESLYRALLALTASPVVAINHAVALAETRGPHAGLDALDALAGDARLADYQPYWAARAGLLARCNQSAEADRAYERAIGLEADPAVRRFLQGQRAALLP